MPIGELRFQFFDVVAQICSDSDIFLSFMRTMYSRFKFAGSSPNQTNLEFHYYRGSDNPWGMPILILPDGTWHGEQVLSLAGYVYDGILNSILSNVHSHLLIHAGVVAKNDKATLLTADSGGGKTTLVLGLVQQGFKFLSDELAPLPRQNGLVDPFPRCLRLRPGFNHLLGLDEPAEQAQLWFDKYLLDIEMIKHKSLGNRSRIANVVVIKEDGEKSSTIGQQTKEIGVFVNRLDADVITAVRRFPGVIQVWQTTELGYPVIRFQAENRMQTLNQVEEFCREQGILILDVSKRPVNHSSFTGPARLDEISKTQGALELIRQFQPGHKSQLIADTYQGQSSRLFMELIEVLGETRCYRLVPGSVNEMIDLVSQLYD